MVPHEEYDVPLFDVPPKYRPPKREQAWPIYRHYKGKHTSCDDCILAIARGEVRFLAAAAAYTRADAQGRRFLCVRHAQEHRLKDGTYSN